MKDFHKHNLDRVLNGGNKKHLQLNNQNSDTKSNLLKSTTNTENSSINSNLENNQKYHNEKNGNQDRLDVNGQTAKRFSPTDRRKHYVMVVLLMIGLIIGLISLLSILMLPSFVSHQISKVRQVFTFLLTAHVAIYSARF